jgi:TonB family protein
MNRSGICHYFGAMLLATFLFQKPATAQIAQIDELISRLDKELKPLKPRLVAVVDLRPPSGANKVQAHYLAWLLSNAMSADDKKKFAVADHKAFDDDLARLHLTPENLIPGDALRAAAPGIGADLLVIGTLDKRGNSYFLQIIPVRVSDSQTFAAISATFESTEFFESMLTPLPADVPRLKGRPEGGYSMPSCIRCPDPSYTNPARRAKINGTSIFEVLISPSGEAAQLRPVKMLGYGLDEKAFEAIKHWKFRPATQNGSPVPIIVPVEVTFRIY